MKATLTFNLEDNDDAMAHHRCIKSMDMAMLLYEIQVNTKKQMLNDYPKINQKMLDTVFEKINKLYEEYDINIDKLNR